MVFGKQRGLFSDTDKTIKEMEEVLGREINLDELYMDTVVEALVKLDERLKALETNK